MMGMLRLLYIAVSHVGGWGGCGRSELGLVLLCVRFREGMEIVQAIGAVRNGEGREGVDTEGLRDQTMRTGLRVF